ncbi:hypothetical protein TRFO_41032 [Tritrichomonas foetus]|uniref:Right handed beta helix domain-containing protein n=1 Tax=Tritrichomonas foetus TaxID=1144522 RepID=A0A1J4L1J2_9EUKA|nr:hypothetical protein TRFO_41032 [Tritrichomonas foetus]|eukprot:OHT17391.1 hypothetical protein TRFO_41032 [Tritrichomonas foetus]
MKPRYSYHYLKYYLKYSKYSKIENFMLSNFTLLSLTSTSSAGVVPFLILPIMAFRSQISVNRLNYARMASSFLTGYSKSSISFSDSKFSHILSASISLSNLKFTDKIFKHKLLTNTSILEITRCSFYYCINGINDFENNEGGALILRGVLLRAKECIFRHNFAFKTAGAIRVSSSVAATIESCLFAQNNCSYFAGALSCFVVFKTEIKNTNFTYNMCEADVSSTAFALCEKVKISNVVFAKNWAMYAGTLYFEKSKATIENNIFFNNSVPNCSSIKLFNASTITIKNSMFTEYNMPSIVCTEIENVLTIINSSFANSEVLEIKQEKAKLEILNCEFEKPNKYEVPELGPINLTAKSSSNNNQQNNLKETTTILNRNQTGKNEQVQKEEIINENIPAAPLPIQKSSNKSIFIITGYVSAIILLVIGIHYFQSVSKISITPKNNSIFMQEDFDVNRQMTSHGNAFDADGLPSLKAADEAAKLPNLDMEEKPSPK